MSRRFVIAAVALPLLALVLAIVRAELFLGGARDFAFEITGYDPRDLLRGHYLQFQLRVDPLPEREACDDASGDCCLCLTETERDAVPYAERASCATARVACDAALHTRFLSEPQRYYVPEAAAAELERRLRDAMQHRGAQVLLAIDRNGEARIRELRIDGEAIPGGAGGRPERPSDDPSGTPLP
jgi:uncharacterized membrane-anchored protein